MNPVWMLAPTLVVTLGFAVVACSPSLSPRGAETKRTTTIVAVPQKSQPEMVFAVVVGIDYNSGMVVLDSVIGQLLTVATQPSSVISIRGISSLCT